MAAKPNEKLLSPEQRDRLIQENDALIVKTKALVDELDALVNKSRGLMQIEARRRGPSRR